MQDVSTIIGGVSDTLSMGVGNFTLSAILRAVIIFLVCIIAVKVLMRVFNKLILKMNVDKSLHAFIRTTVKILLYFVAVIIVADSLGIPITSLIAVLSVAGLALSLAIQGVLSNIAGGIMVLSSKPFGVGDYIEAGGVGATVKEIGLAYTKLATADNKLIYIPNSDISASQIVNYSANDARRIEIKIGASYDDSIEDVKKALNQVIANNEVLEEPAKPFVNVSAYQDSYIEYVVRVWVENAKYWDVYFKMLEDIKASFDKNNITMTYNHLNVHMMKD